MELTAHTIFLSSDPHKNFPRYEVRWKQPAFLLTGQKVWKDTKTSIQDREPVSNVLESILSSNGFRWPFEPAQNPNKVLDHQLLVFKDEHPLELQKRYLKTIVKPVSSSSALRQETRRSLRFGFLLSEFFARESPLQGDARTRNRASGSRPELLASCSKPADNPRTCPQS
jgi:hypothetical protein